jgi:hypothetical protein
MTSDRILVLKDGQIVEQGNHTELLTKGGLFASMWADQVSANEDSFSTTDKKSTVIGYAVDEEPSTAVEDIAPEPLVDVSEIQPENVPVDTDINSPVNAGDVVTDSPVAFPSDEPIEPDTAAPITFPISDEPEPEPVAFPTTDEPINDTVVAAPFPSIEAQEQPAPVAFPSEGRDSPAPAGLAFPGEDASSVNNTPSIGGTPGVTFQNVPTPASDGATPDLDQDGKRKRTLSTQGIQRLARRMSVSGRRQGSSNSIPAAIFNSLKRDNSSVSRDSKELAREESNKEGSVREDGVLADSLSASPVVNDSPSGSSNDLSRSKTKKDNKKKDGKEKKRRSTTLGLNMGFGTSSNAAQD